MNEYLTWSRRDRHARAFETLRSERSQQIARRLGIEDAPSAAMCLDCHADHVEPERRGRAFQLADGVGCESCHGGAEHWIESHANGATHRDNVERGLYRSDDAQARAELCLSCHLGNARKPLTHRLMAAGHPRTPFELDTWTQLQPAHFTTDRRYRERKETSSPVRVWAMGQAVTLHAYAEALADPERSHDGAGPEPALADCYSCHRPFGASPLGGDAFGLRPGLPRLDEARFFTVRSLLHALGSPLSRELDGHLRALNTARSHGAGIDAAAAAIARVVAAEYATIQSWEPNRDSLVVLLKSLVVSSREHRFRTYAAAEQATLAFQAILATLSDDMVSGDDRQRFRNALDAMFAATQDERRFEAAQFERAIARVPNLNP